MERVRARDAAAFEELYDSFYRLVYGIGLRMLGETAGAEDVTQAVFLKVWTAPEAFRGGNLGAWLSRVTRNRCLDVLRSRGARSEEAVPDDLPVDGALDELVFARIDGAQVRQALSTLPPDQRELIEGGFFEGITHHELARRTEVPLGTVKTRIRSGLRKLRVALEASVVP